MTTTEAIGSTTVSTPSSSPTPRTARPPGALLTLALSVLLASMGTSIANVALPTLATAFDAPFDHVQWVVLVYLLAVTTTVVTAGALGDLLGRRRMFVLGAGLFTVASALCGLVPNLAFLLVARAVQGTGAALMTALAMPLVAENVPFQRTGSAIGLLGTMSAIGTALGPSLGGILIAGLGWRSIFLVTAALGLVALLLSSTRIASDSKPTGRRFDLFGAVTLTLALAGYALAITYRSGALHRANAILLVGSILALAIFIAVERRAPSPLLQLRILREGELPLFLIMNGVASAVVMATLVIGPFHLSRSLELTTAMVGLAMSCGPLVAAGTGVPAGRMVDRFGSRATTQAGLAAMSLAAVLLATVPLSFGLVGYLGPIVVLTAGYAVFQAANNTGALRDLDPGRRGLVSGLMNLSRNLGLLTGASAMGAIYVAGSRRGIWLADLTDADPGLSLSFGVAALLLGATLATAFKTHRPSRSSRSLASSLETAPEGSVAAR